jgi:pyridinium-3,5-bisthiocarboxylic acid mononucleotide nickel chelatase
MSKQRTFLFLDLNAGISGNMLLAALLDLGVETDRLQREIDKLGLKGVHLEVGSMRKQSLQALHARVVYPAETSHRHLNHILKIITESDLTPSTKSRSCRIFEKLAAAEARAHGIPIDEVHFHEVGAVDAIVDVVSSVFLLEHLGVERVVASPPRLGYGTVNCAHGQIPIPAPATAFLLEGSPSFQGDIEGEYATPTGAAILSEIVSEYGRQPLMRPVAIGMGAGDRNPPFPNCVRAFLAEADQPTMSNPLLQEDILQLETHVDDMDGEALGFLSERLLAGPASEVSIIPMTTKKSRPGHIVRVLGMPEHQDKLIQLLFAHSSTLGVRVSQQTRYILPRDSVMVSTKWGDVRAKRVLVDGIERVKAEFDDCAALALKAGVPLQTVKKAVECESISGHFTGKTDDWEEN